MNKTAEKYIKKYCNELEQIFAPINEKVCGPCFERDNGCCKRCAENNGYFKHELFHSRKQNAVSLRYEETYNAIKWHLFEDINKLKLEYGFDEVKGFLDTENKRCRLPRWKRSITCLNYYCPKSVSHWTSGTIHDLCKKILKIRLKARGLIAI